MHDLNSTHSFSCLCVFRGSGATLPHTLRYKMASICWARQLSLVVIWVGVWEMCGGY